MKLKKYQKESLQVLSGFLDGYQKDGLNDAFLDNNPNDLTPYNRPPWNDKDLAKKSPYICLKAPTGSGKTIMAAAWLGEIISHSSFSNSELAIILAPNKNIVAKTIKEYKDPFSALHQILSKKASKPLKVVNTKEALRLCPQDFTNYFIVIIGTYAALKREDTESLLLYRDNSNLIDFFQNLSKEEEDLLLSDTEESDASYPTRPAYSLINLLRLKKPILINDESHHSNSELSHNTIENINPSFVLETSATPREKSNILHAINPLDVRQEDMISLPMEIHDSLNWQNAIYDGMKRRDELSEMKQRAGHLNEAIALIQAERASHTDSTLKDGFVSVYDAKEALIKNGAKESEIAISTGNLNQVSVIDWEHNKDIKYVITVKAGAEGWDCPAAYILVALAPTLSVTAAEQLVGRVLRREGACHYLEDDLNKSYVYSGTPSFLKTVQAVQKGVEAHGYDGESVLVNQGNINQAMPTKDLTLLRKQFQDVTYPGFGIKEGGKISVVKDPGRWVELAANWGEEINTKPLSKTISSGQSGEKSFALDIDQDGLSTHELKNGQVLAAKTGSGDRQAIINHLVKNIRVNYVSHKQIKKIVEGTINKTYKNWSAADLWRHLDAIETQIQNKITLRLKALSKRTIEKGVQNETIKQIDIPLSKTLEQVAAPVNGISLDGCLYEATGGMNGLEESVAEILAKNDKLSWMRNPERAPGAIAIPGLGRMHYPDFFLDKNGQGIFIESKGEHLIGSGDSNEKLFLGQQLSLAGAGRCDYYMVGEKNDGGGRHEASLDELRKILS